MASSANGIGSFMTDNIVSVLRHLPETNGTYAHIEAGRTQTAYARFSQRYNSIMAEHCSPDANRNR